VTSSVHVVLMYDMVGQRCDNALEFIDSGLRAREVCEERKLGIELDASEDNTRSAARTATPARCRTCYELFPSKLVLSAQYERQMCSKRMPAIKMTM
jgi:hypothetical protein